MVNGNPHFLTVMNTGHKGKGNGIPLFQGLRITRGYSSNIKISRNDSLWCQSIYFWLWGQWNFGDVQCLDLPPRKASWKSRSSYWISSCQRMLPSSSLATPGPYPTSNSSCQHLPDLYSIFVGWEGGDVWVKQHFQVDDKLRQVAGNLPRSVLDFFFATDRYAYLDTVNK